MHTQLKTSVCQASQPSLIPPTRLDITAKDCAAIFFEKWYCENGLPLEIISDRDKLFTSAFWKELHRLTGTKVKLSSAFHPETDGASERTNKTLNQTLRYLVDRQQKGWVKQLPYVRFVMMNTVNASTGYSPFYLKTGRNPRTIPPIDAIPFALERGDGGDIEDAKSHLEALAHTLEEVRDNLIEAKTRQAHYANQKRGPEDSYRVEDLVMLSTANRRREYKGSGQNRSAKLMPRWEGPIEVIRAYPERSEYTLALPSHSNTFPSFHSSQLKRYVPNDRDQFPDRQPEQPGPLLYDAEGEPMYEAERIVDERRAGAGWRYRVKFVGWEDDNWWLSRSELRRTAPELVAAWERDHPK